jgi:hypothetical protein
MPKENVLYQNWKLPKTDEKNTIGSSGLCPQNNIGFHLKPLRAALPGQ